MPGLPIEVKMSCRRGTCLQAGRLSEDEQGRQR